MYYSYFKELDFYLPTCQSNLLRSPIDGVINPLVDTNEVFDERNTTSEAVHGRNFVFESTKTLPDVK